MLFSAATITEAAIVDSVSRDGRVMNPRTARLKVIECAIVNAVTMLMTSRNARRKVVTACHFHLVARAPPGAATRTERVCDRNRSRCARRRSEKSREIGARARPNALRAARFRGPG